VNAAADVVLAAAWAAVVVPGLRLATPRGRTLRLVLLVCLGLGVWLLTVLRGGRAPHDPVLETVGLLVCGSGVVLHWRARRALGPAFATQPVVPTSGLLATHGPYAIVRHPMYAAVLLVALGTLLVCRSAATVCLLLGLAIGLAWKARREDAILAAGLGPAWEEYAARVPALIPQLRRAAPP